MKNSLMTIIGGVIVLVVGLVLADVVIDSVTTALTNASIGSFTGATGIGGLIPMLYFVVLIAITIALVAIGGTGLVRGGGGLGLSMVPVAIVGVSLVSGYMLPVVVTGFATYYGVQYLAARRERQLV